MQYISIKREFYGSLFSICIFSTKKKQTNIDSAFKKLFKFYNDIFSLILKAYISTMFQDIHSITYIFLYIATHWSNLTTKSSWMKEKNTKNEWKKNHGNNNSNKIPFHDSMKKKENKRETRIFRSHWQTKLSCKDKTSSFSYLFLTYSFNAFSCSLLQLSLFCFSAVSFLYKRRYVWIILYTEMEIMFKSTE